MIVVSTPSYFIFSEVTIDDKALTISINQHNNRRFKKGFNFFLRYITMVNVTELFEQTTYVMAQTIRVLFYSFYNIAVYILKC